ncbi:MAG: large ribosomal subunit protein bL35 [Candidatus Bipolaricaulaceae bacterium]
MKTRTHSSGKKRFKVKPSGKVFRRKAGYVHKLTKKRPKYRRQARREVEVCGTDHRRLRRLLGI